jgi:hypothetical protein
MPHHRRTFGRDCNVKWRRTIVGRLIWIGSKFEEPRDQRVRCELRSDVKSTPTRLVPGRNIGTRREQPMNDCRMAAPYSEMKSSRAGPIAKLDIRTP